MLSEMARLIQAHRVQKLDTITVYVGLPWTRLVPAHDTIPALIAIESPL